MALLNNFTVYIAGIGSQKTGGIGISMVHLFLEKGWKVLAACEADAADEMQQLSLESHAGTLLYSVVNSRISEDIKEFAAGIVMEYSSIDLFLHCSDSILQDETDNTLWSDEYDRNALGLLRHVQYMLPLLAQGERKRIALISSTNSLINSCSPDRSYIHSMVGAARHKAGAILFNDLNKEGYSFRVFCLDKDAPSEPADIYRYISRDRCYNEGDPSHSDEKRYVPRDGTGKEYAW